MIASCTQRVNWALNCARLFLTTHPLNNQTTCIRPSSTIIPRGDLRQRGGRLLVTRGLIHSYSCWFSPAHSVRNYRGSRAAIFTSPLSPAFDLFLYQALLFSISGLCLYYFRLYEALRFWARTRQSAKGPTAQTGTAEHCWPQAHSWAKPRHLTAPSSHVL